MIKVYILNITLPLDPSISTIGTTKFVYQGWRGLTLTPAGDCLDLVGVWDMQYHISTQKVKKKTNKIHISD